MKIAITILAATLLTGCSLVKDFMPSIERPLTNGDISLDANIPLNLQPKHPRNRRRDQIGVTVFPADAKRISREEVITTSGTNYTINVTMQDSLGMVHQLRAYWWTPRSIFFAVTPTPVDTVQFTNIIITTSTRATFSSIVWQQYEVK